MDEIECSPGLPTTMDPLGKGDIVIPRGILGYAAGANAFWDGLNNVSIGTYDKTARTWADLSGNGYTISGINAAQWDELGGINGAVISQPQCAASPFTAQFSVELVFRRENAAKSCWWVSNRYPWNTAQTRGMQLGQYGSTAMNFAVIYGNSILVEIPVISSDRTSGTIVITYDGATLASHVSGEQAGVASIQIPQDCLASSPLLVGYAANGSFYLPNADWKIHALRIYDRVLTSSEVSANYLLDKQRYAIE